jgi:hypothetical protein
VHFAQEKEGQGVERESEGLVFNDTAYLALCNSDTKRSTFLAISRI